MENADNGGGENALHAYFADAFPDLPGVVGPGDDCAQLKVGEDRYLHWTCDQLVEGIHVEAEATPEIQAKKLLRRTLSDLAAAAATPWLVSWTVAAPSDRPKSWLRALAEAFVREAQQFDVGVVGGDLSSCPPGSAAVMTCTAIGKSSQPAPGRDGAQPGNWILLSGRLGDAVRSGRHLLPQPRLAEGRRLARNYQPTAMMDLSDGLAQDLPRILRASGVGARVELTALPLHSPLPANPEGWVHALGDGEDYELLLTLPAERAAQALADSEFSSIGLHKVGEITAEPELIWLENGEKRPLRVDGWEHRWKEDSDGTAN